jgi:hypothetical protein
MRDEAIAAWLVLFDCGHTRHPLRCYCGGDDNGHAPHDGPPPVGWAGWCEDCGDYRTTVDVIDAAPLSPESGGSDE